MKKKEICQVIENAIKALASDSRDDLQRFQYYEDDVLIIYPVKSTFAWFAKKDEVK